MNISLATFDAEGSRQNLRMILAHLCDLHLLGSTAYGHLGAADVPPTMQSLLDSLVETVREATGTIAERLRILDAVSHGPALTASCTPSGQRSTAELFDRIAVRIATVVAIIDNVRGRVGAADPATGDLLRAIIRAFDEHASTFKSQQHA
ncbi:DNA starvation/stationary phase protection protein [Mycobacterium sp. 3519A]|uniref:DNA starvation/stationary phase protection protein n=1 Tax=Mycobacterium sp. 3519A TaxID=2057184 RepID=UPI000C7D6EC7|nr:DNA starvation/stationary phase protection protein [Mycobacterium sp. 3519A]